MFPTVNLYRSALMLILLLASILEVVGGCQRPSNSARRHADSLLVAPSAINASYLRATVRQWSVDWEDGARNITLDDLKYRYPISGAHDPPDSRILHVVALYIPANIVEKMKSNIAEKMKHISRPDKPKQ
jgi:hypothetical protein